MCVGQEYLSLSFSDRYKVGGRERERVACTRKHAHASRKCGRALSLPREKVWRAKSVPHSVSMRDYNIN